jgi:hypothetical protein
VGATQLQRLQVGKESVKGTAVTTGKILTGILGQIADTSELKIVQNTYQTGLMGGSNQGTPVFVSRIRLRLPSVAISRLRTGCTCLTPDGVALPRPLLRLC